MANPFVKPGGSSFPVFTNGNSLRAFPWGDKGEELILVLQFDFSQPTNLSGNGLSSSTGLYNGNDLVSYFIDPRPLFGTRVPKSFKSLLISADFNPSYGGSAGYPYMPIAIAESSIGQLLYLTNKSLLAQQVTQVVTTNINLDCKASACFDLLSQPGATFALSQSAPNNNSQPVASGIVILSTFRMQPFVAN